MVPPLTAVRNAIARAILGDARDDAVTLGTVTLRAHQRDALRRVRTSIASTGGALLADEPGLGKTFVALALARESSHAIIVAPAALRAMWRGALAEAGTTAQFASLEALSRHDVTVAAAGGLVIVDEAHHACNPATARYARLARLVSYRHVLLLSATPVRNRRDEMAALLALFMGPRAHTLDDAERARCIVRRSGDASLVPPTDGPHWHAVRTVRGLGAMITQLPPPLPALDGREAAGLLAMTLARCWASSLAALDSALRRRLQRGVALESLLDEGRMPTREEFRAWVVGDDAVQLAFPMFAAHVTADAVKLRAVLDAHLHAVRALRARIASRLSTDAIARGRVLLDLRAAHAGARIVAFTAHAATAEAVFRALGRESGIALLTAGGARTAGGRRPRSDVIDALAGRDRDIPVNENAGDEISLVLTTDLLSEGVNLQGASVIVHLDIPWTPAGLDQRVGRAARMGSTHARVYVYGIAPPAAAERLLTFGRRLGHKRAEQAEAARAPEELERLRSFMNTWRVAANDRHVESMESVESVVASVHAERPGFIAVVEARGECFATAGFLHGTSRWKISDAPRDIHEAAGMAQSSAAKPDAGFESRVRTALDRWLDHRVASESSAAANPSSRARRTLLGQIDAALARCSAHTRPALAERAIRLRIRIDRATGAGAERVLAELAQLTLSDIERWLDTCESRLAPRAVPAARTENAAPIVRALLLLQLS